VPSVVRELTAPPKFGLNAGSMAPVVASKAKIRLRTTSSPVFPKVPAGLTEVKEPAAMILLPTWVIASTEPFMTCGVVLTGSAETTALPWSAFTAVAGAAPRAETPSVAASEVARTKPLVRRARACMGFPWGRHGVGGAGSRGRRPSRP
jgi:hypothetical protein